MPCFSPVMAVPRYKECGKVAGYSDFTSFNNFNSFEFDPECSAQDYDLDDLFLKRERTRGYHRLNCGKCLSCRLSRSQMWAVRLSHHAQMFEDSVVLTLTYRDSDLPENGSLQLSDVQKFIKRLRYYRLGQKISYFLVGEYGSKFSRPHYHLILFNCSFSDKVYFKKSRTGVKLYTSPELSTLWPHGHSDVSTMSFEAAGYVARYSLKKSKNIDYGLRKPEFMTCSNGIGREWFDKFWMDIFPKDYFVHEGRKVMVPRYYLKLLEKKFPHMYDRVCSQRCSRAAFAQKVPPSRLAVLAECLAARASSLKRNYDSGFDRSSYD